MSADYSFARGCGTSVKFHMRVVSVYPCKGNFMPQQAAELLSEGRAKHERGDRMGAVMMYEKALKKVRIATARRSAPSSICSCL